MGTRDLLRSVCTSRDVRTPGQYEIYQGPFIQLSRKPDFIKTILRLFERPDQPDQSRLRTSGTQERRAELWFSNQQTDPTSNGRQDWAPLKRGECPSLRARLLQRQFLAILAIEISQARRRNSRCWKVAGPGNRISSRLSFAGETNTLHLRAYLDGAATKYAWAGLDSTPLPIRELVARTSRKSALAWSLFGNGVFFDPTRTTTLGQTRNPLLRTLRRQWMKLLHHLAISER